MASTGARLELPIRIRNLTADDASEVVQLYREALPGDFAVLLGEEFLARVLFPELLRASEVALGAEDSNGLVAFVFFSSDHGFFPRLVRRRSLVMLRYAIRKLVYLSFLQYLGEVLLLLLSRRGPLAKYELSYIAVRPKYQGRGVGSRLTKAGLAALSEYGARDCWVKTMNATPLNVRFYEKLGFRMVKSHLGRTYLAMHF